MYCKRLKATMKVSACHKRQEKAHRDLGYGVCRDCPQVLKVNAGKESDRDIDRIIRELSQSLPPAGYYHWAPLTKGKPKFDNLFQKRRTAPREKDRMNST